MPKPIYMTEDMIKECFDDVRDSFEAAYKKAFDAAAKTKLVNGLFEFKYSGIDYKWKDDHSRARVTLSPEAYAKMLMLVLKTDKEIGWHGLITRDEEGKSNFTVNDIILFPQEVTSTTVVADEQKYPEWVLGLDDAQFNTLRFHGHSHVNMGCTPSSTDMTYRSDLIKQYDKGFYVFLIINKKMEWTAQVYDFDENVLFDTADINVVIGDEFSKKLDEDRLAMVKQYVYTPPKSTSTPSGKQASLYENDYYRGGWNSDSYYR